MEIVGEQQRKNNQESVGSWSSSTLAKQVKKLLLDEDVTGDPRIQILNIVSGIRVTLSRGETGKQELRASRKEFFLYACAGPGRLG